MVQPLKLLSLIIALSVSSYSLAASLSLVKNDDNVIRWAGCGITKKAFMSELAVHYENKTGIKVLLSGGGATKGLQDAATLKIDIGGSCRMNLPGINKAEILADLHPIAWDALAVIVHKSNPVNNLTTEQIKGIYTGKIVNWRQLGGPDQSIELYVRRGKLSGVGYTIRQYVFKDSDVEFVQNHVVNSSGPLEKAVERDMWALGMTGISSAKKRNVKILNFDRKSPTYANVKNGSYGLYRPLYLVTTASPSKKVRDFISFATSEEGQQIIRENGTVPYKEALNLMSKLLIYGFGVN